ncbi:MAG: hypothetical protein IPL61_25460 [Myxococcales bacterium]|nr:hypothetical protein [Myxococcales bacterium]
MSHSAGLVFVAVVLGACGGDRPAAPTIHNQPSDPTMATTTELPVTARWAGPIQVGADDPGLVALAIRDAAAYDALLARLPAHRIQMKQPAPPSDDPLRARPPIEFATRMLVVVTRGDTVGAPTIARVEAGPDRVVVRVVAPSPPPEARPLGVGGYAAVEVPRVDGPVTIVGPRVITDPADVPGAVGELVTLRGPLARTRLPTLLGVDIDEGDADGDAPTEASGWLERTVVTQAEIDAQIAASGQFAHRGPGTFYALRAPVGDGLAAARRAW